MDIVDKKISNFESFPVPRPILCSFDNSKNNVLSVDQNILERKSSSVISKPTNTNNNDLIENIQRKSRDTLSLNSGTEWELVDALPYVDPLDNEEQAEIKRLLDEEMEIIRKENEGKIDYLSFLPPPLTPYIDNTENIIGREMKRCALGEEFKKLNFDIYSEIIPPNNENADLSEWKSSARAVKFLLEHAHTAIINLELMIYYLKGSWLRYIADLESLEKVFSEVLSKTRSKSEEINKRRKLDQLSCGNVLRSLVKEHTEYIEKNKKITASLLDLESEIIVLRDNCMKKGVAIEKFQFFEDIVESS